MKKMKKMKWIILVVGFVILGTSQGYAVVPTIDGAFGVGEWDGFVAQGFDGNEVLIPDAYDLKEMRLIFEDTGGASDGLYALILTWAAPSLVDTGLGPPPASISTLLDSNGDLDFSDSVDFFTIHTLASGFDVFDGTGALILDGVEGTHFKLASVIEYFIPESVLSGWPYSSFSSFALYDNGGDSPDDRLPNSGFTGPIPEPSTWLLIGSGLLGILGFGTHRRFVG